MSHPRPWYSDPSILTDTHLLDPNLETALYKQSSKIILQTKHGIFCRKGKYPLYLFAEDVDRLLQGKQLRTLVLPNQTTTTDIVAWIGHYQHTDYWVLYSDDLLISNDSTLPLREFGDRLHNGTDAALLATANGLVHFHQSHGFCSRCGNPTVSYKAGTCRRCTQCLRSIYPRLDVASIMLVISRCHQYALLGRKANWPKGLYSTLAGFTQIGETIEDCCIRETLEESGVVVDPLTVQFVSSQPWPFPQSVMVGFQAMALEEGLPTVTIDETEMQDVQWFHKDFVRERLSGGSSALDFQPNETEQEFHVPGKASLARLLVSRWANGDE